jgi:hypothetical protein
VSLQPISKRAHADSGIVSVRKRHGGARQRGTNMTDFDTTELTVDAYAAGGPLQLAFVNPPALDGDAVEWTYRTLGGATAPAGTVVAQIVVMASNHNILGGGSTTLHTDLGPHDTGASRVRPLQYTPADGDYYLSITVGDDVRYVSYRVTDRRIQAT